jgi:hypothetical protein
MQTSSHIPDEIIDSIFSFLEPTQQQMRTITQTCSTWKRVGSHDTYWQTIYEQEYAKYLESVNVFDRKLQMVPVQQRNYRRYFFDLKKYCVEGTRKTMYARSVILGVEQSVIYTGTGYILSLICTFVTLLLSVFVYTICGLLFVNGKIQKVAKNHAFMLIPYILLLFTPLVILYVVYIIYTFWLKRYQYYGTWTKLPIYSGNRKDEYEIIDCIMLVMGMFGVFPVAGVCAYIRLVFNLKYVAWRGILSPFYLYAILYIIIPPIIRYINQNRNGMPYFNFQFIRIQFSAWIIGSIVQLLLSIQLGVLSAKLDQSTKSTLYWIVVFIPTYLLFVLCCLIGPISIAMRDRLHKDLMPTIYTVVAGVVASVFFIPVIVWLILYALTLDQFITVSLVVIWVPLYVLLGGLMCIILSMIIVVFVIYCCFSALLESDTH